jgi:formylglycine-generating enzyme required for sulfatase activity/5-hydroxyisourate hydrolase-like protein (transthyretin family)
MKIMSYSHKLLLCLLLLLSTNALKAIEGFSLIPAGAFTMGNSVAEDTDITDAATSMVTLNAFYMGKYEVTKAEWNDVYTWAISNGYTDLSPGASRANDHPVHSISWYDMVKWCNARSEKEGLKPVYYTDDIQMTIYKTGNLYLTNSQVKWGANGYRLPTEAEWEKAARGGLSGKRFPWGDTISHSQANYYASSSDNYDLSGSVNNHHPTYATGDYQYTSPVGSLAANGYGLYDMAGNVDEWCWNKYQYFTSERQTNPRGDDRGDGSMVFRGGNWQSSARYVRLADRPRAGPDYKDDTLGFRVVRSDLNLDSDGDDIYDYDEFQYNTDPRVADTDGDGYLDGEEARWGSIPNDALSYPTVFLTLETKSGGRIDPQDVGGGYWSWHTNSGYVVGNLRSHVRLKAIPESGYLFTSWTGVVNGSSNPLDMMLTDPFPSIQANFEPDQSDSDGDGLSNYQELVTCKTNPNSFDSDNDQLSDGDEINYRVTNPLMADTDGDGYFDGEEIKWGSLPSDYSSKPQAKLILSVNGLGNIYSEGIDNHDEIWGSPYYTSSGKASLRSTVTLEAHSFPGCLFTGWSGDVASSSYVLDLLLDTNKTVQANFLPDESDADGDSLTNYDEALTYYTDSNSSDTDGDGYSDGEEVERGLDPNNSGSKPQVYLSFSSNGGGRINATGIGSYSYWWGWYEDYYQDPYNGYVDLRSTVTLTATPFSGYLFSGWSGGAAGTSNSLSLTMDVDKSVQASFEPDYADSDGDGLTNYAEVVTYSTDPNSSDSDWDGFSDGEEVERGSNPKDSWSKPLGSISGVATDKSGVGLAGISVVAYRYYDYDNYGSWYATSSTTGENGSYQLHGLNAGRYRIEFRDYSGEYLSGWSTFITISESEEVEFINASLVKPSSISGTITDDKGSPLEGIEVSVYSINSDSDEPGVQWDWISYATTDADGAYTVSGLSAGTYRLAFRSGWNGDFLTEYYNNALSIDSAQDIVLSEAENKVGIDASLTSASSINGVVTDQNGSPLEEILVSVYQYDSNDEWWHWVKNAFTDEYGEYSLGGLAAGTYRVEFRDYYGEYAVECYENAANLDSAKDIIVAESTYISGIDASLVKASGISGVVTGPNGQTPLANVEVELERWTGGDWIWQGQTLTDGNGSYQFDGLPAGTYRIEFEDESGQYALEYFNNEVEFDLAENIILAPEQQVENINASLVPGSRINGKVTGPDGNPLPDVDIDVFRLQENGQWDWYEDTEANADGTYEIGGLPNGTYRVGFLDDDEVHAVQFYKNNGNTMYFELARNLVINSPQTIPEVNAKFDKKAGTIKGKVTGSDGSTPLHEVRIEAYRKDDQGSWRLVLFGDVESDDDGFFDPSMLPAGTYRFKFQKDGYLTKFYGDAYSIAGSKDIVLSDGQVVEGIKVSLSTEPAPQSISAFASVGKKTFGDAPFAVTRPSATSGQAVILKVKSGPATISGNIVTITGAGPVVLAANQAGDANYSAATEVTTSFTVMKAAQTIAAFTPIPNKMISDAPFAVAVPVASSGLLVSMSVKSGPATISNNIVTITGAGIVTIAANQPGNDNYNPATEVTTDIVAVGITSDLKETIIPSGKLMPRYVVTNNFGAKEYTARGLPPGMKINRNTGVISGKTKKKGTYNVTITATKRDKKKKILQSVRVVKVFKVN